MLCFICFFLNFFYFCIFFFQYLTTFVCFSFSRFVHFIFKLNYLQLGYDFSFVVIYLFKLHLALDFQFNLICLCFCIYVCMYKCFNFFHLFFTFRKLYHIFVRMSHLQIWKVYRFFIILLFFAHNSSQSELQFLYNVLSCEKFFKRKL